MKRQGQLVRWESARGFGFIRSPDISADVFVHLRDFVDRGMAPQVGTGARFEGDPCGRQGPRAVAVEAIGATLRHGQSPATDTGRSAPPSTRCTGTHPSARGGTAHRPTLPFLVLAIGYAALVAYGV